jgi:hypothetical protein
MVFIKSVELPARTDYLGGPTETFVEVVWGDPLSQKQYTRRDPRSAIDSIAADGFKTASEFVLTVPKSVSVVSEVFEHARLRAAVVDEARVLGHSLLRKARVAHELESPPGDVKTRFVMFCHRTTDQNDGPPLPHLNIHLLAFAAACKGRSYRLGDLDLRPVYERRETFHSQLLCGLADRIQKLGYAVVPTATGFELAGVPQDIIDDFSASAPQNKEGSARHRWDPQDVQDLWQDRLGTRRLNLPKAAPTPSLKRPPHLNEIPSLERSLDAVFADDVLIPAPAFLSALFRGSIGICRPFQALRWLHGHRIPPGGTMRDGMLFRTIVLGSDAMLCRCSDYDGLGRITNLSRDAKRVATPWVSLATVGQKACDWALTDKLLLTRNPVMGLVVAKGPLANGRRVALRTAFESQNGVGMFASNDSWDERKAELKHQLWGRWSDLKARTASLSALPDVVWVLDADKIPQRSILDVSSALLKAGKKLVLEASGVTADSRIMVLVSALAGKVWHQAQLFPEGRVAEERNLTSTRGIQFTTVPSTDIEAAYEAVFRQDKETVLVCADRSEADGYVKSIRSRLFREGGEVGPGQYRVLQLKDLGWTEAEKQDPRNFRVGQWIRFRRRIRNFGPTEKLRVLERRDGRVIVEKYGSLEAPLPLNYPADLEVYEAAFQPAGLGELLRVSRFHRTKIGTRFDAGELVVLSSGRQRKFRPPKGESPREWLHTTADKWLPVDFGFWNYGYCTTPDAPPLSVRNVMVLPGALPAFEPSVWLPRIKAGGTVIAVGVTREHLVRHFGLQPKPLYPRAKKRRLIVNLPGLQQSLSEPEQISPVQSPTRVRLPDDWQKSYPTKPAATPRQTTTVPIHSPKTSGLRDLI